MDSRADQTQPTATELADLSALADGTLDPARKADVEARIAASPQLTALYERERRVVDALYQARATERAPQRLRTKIEASRPSRASAARRRFVYAGGVAAALAAVVLALVLALPSGTPGSPSVSDAAALAARGPTQAAPAPDPTLPGARLQESVGDVYFPNWTSKLGWTATGERTDT
ncbi:MAG: anti-sigma factor family protein, partial [Solirubrobacteraceae bacterium]